MRMVIENNVILGTQKIDMYLFPLPFIIEIFGLSVLVWDLYNKLMD